MYTKSWEKPWSQSSDFMNALGRTVSNQHADASGSCANNCWQRESPMVFLAQLLLSSVFYLEWCSDICCSCFDLEGNISPQVWHGKLTADVSIPVEGSLGGTGDPPTVGEFTGDSDISPVFRDKSIGSFSCSSSRLSWSGAFGFCIVITITIIFVNSKRCCHKHFELNFCIP